MAVIVGRHRSPVASATSAFHTSSTRSLLWSGVAGASQGYGHGVMSPDTESPTAEEINDLAVRTVRAIRAERAGVSWDVRSVAAYLDCSRRHVRRLIVAGELEGERTADSRTWAIPVRSMLAFEDRRYAARVEADRRSPGARGAVVATE